MTPLPTRPHCLSDHICTNFYWILDTKQICHSVSFADYRSNWRLQPDRYIYLPIRIPPNTCTSQPMYVPTHIPSNPCTSQPFASQVTYNCTLLSCESMTNTANLHYIIIICSPSQVPPIAQVTGPPRCSLMGLVDSSEIVVKNLLWSVFATCHLIL